MTVKDIPRLLEKLNDYCQNTLATGVGVCGSRGHYEVRWEHLLLEFIERNDGDIPLILRQFGVDESHLKKAVTLELENLRTGNTGKPLFSPPLLDGIEAAWSLASLELGLPAITSGTLFIAALEHGQLVLSSYGNLLRGITIETLKKDFYSITGSSVEQTDKKGPAAPGMPSTGGKGDVLSQFCTNFTQQARDGKIDPILGRDGEIRQALDILSRRRKNNPILVGEAGVGKTAIVEGLALRIAAGDVPDHLKNVDLWGLDLGLLQAGASVKGEFEKRLKNVIDAIKNSPKPTILFIDEAHTLVGAGGAAGQGDAANLLKPALARGELRTLAATTWLEYRKYFEKDPALARRFQLVKIEEPDEATCAIMMRGISASYEKHHGVRITYDGIRVAVSYSHRYISGRQLPDKAVDVLDTACARVKMSQSTKPAALDSAERSLLNAELELKTLQKDLDAGIAPSADAIEICTALIAELKERITALTEQWNKEKQIAFSIIKLQDDLVKAKETGEAEKKVRELTASIDAET